MGFASIAKFIWENPGNKGQRLRRYGRAIEWQIYKRVIAKPRVINLPNGLKFNAYPDCVVSSSLQYAAWPEYHEIHFCRQHLKPGDLVIDVGANVGHFSLLMADIVGGGNVLCFEPTPVSYRRLLANFNANCFPTQRLIQAALGSEPGTAVFPDTDRPVTTNSLGSAQSSGKTVSVEVQTMDQWSSKLEPKSVGLLKIDVEGFEAQLFAGAKSFLKRIRPRLIMFESLGGKIEHSIKRVLTETGYNAFQLSMQGNPDEGELDAQNLFARF